MAQGSPKDGRLRLGLRRRDDAAARGLEGRARVDADRARSFGANRRLPFSRPDELEELWRTTGLNEVELGKISAGAEYADLDDLWHPFIAGVGGLGGFVQSLDEGARTRMKLDVASNLGNPQGASGDGHVVETAWAEGRALNLGSALELAAV